MNVFMKWPTRWSLNQTKRIGECFLHCSLLILIQSFESMLFQGQVGRKGSKFVYWKSLGKWLRKEEAILHISWVQNHNELRRWPKARGYMIYQTYHTLWGKIRWTAYRREFLIGIQKYTYEKCVECHLIFSQHFMWHLSQGLQPFLSFFFIMFEFIYLFVIIQKEQCRLIPSYNGLLHKPVFTKVFQLNLQKSPWGWRREWATRCNFIFQAENRSADISTKRNLWARYRCFCL